MKKLWTWFRIQTSNHILFVVFSVILLSYTVSLAFFCFEESSVKDCGELLFAAAGLTTILSLVLVYEGLSRTRIAAEAQLLSTYNDKYFENDMLNAIRILRRWSDSHPTRFAIHRTPENNPRDALGFQDAQDFTWTAEVDMARRKVKAYFVNALDLYERDMLSRRFFIDIINKDAITTLFDIVEPLEWYLNKQYNASKFHGLMAYASDIYKARCNGQHQNSRVREEEPTPQDSPSSQGEASVKMYSLVNVGCFNQRP